MKLFFKLGLGVIGATSVLALAGCSDSDTKVSTSNILFEDMAIKFDGETHKLEVKNAPKGVSYTYEGNEHKEIGSYTAKVMFTAEKGYTLDGVTSKEAVLTIYNSKVDFYVPNIIGMRMGGDFDINQIPFVTLDELKTVLQTQNMIIKFKYETEMLDNLLEYNFNEEYIIPSFHIFSEGVEVEFLSQMFIFNWFESKEKLVEYYTPGETMPNEENIIKSIKKGQLNAMAYGFTKSVMPSK
ncbi:MAG: hypothetical protein ACRC5M_01160 [Anaeroplasmataceae bacterium]